MSFSEFTASDYELINAEWESLQTLARNRCKDDEEFQTVQRAFEFANQAHKNVRRRSGEPYIMHPIWVAKITVSDIGLGCKSICAALLHDVAEDTEYTVDDIRSLFGDKVALLVDGLTKIKTVLDNEDRKSSGAEYTESLQAENFKRILLTLNDDVRVALIKLADRLHNCRTIEFMPEHKRDKILSETMFIFIPLAHRLGLYSIKTEMENIWLKYKEPDEYAEISKRINRNVVLRDKEIDDFIDPIRDALESSGFSFTIKKRIKTPYSIYYKMRTKNLPFEEIFDLYAVRIVYEPHGQSSDAERNEAYLIYATLLKLYHDRQSRFRDWIKQPKSNGYEALHCTLMSHSGIWIEVQIRSRRMDDIAEKGIAAHWAYKNNGYASENDSEMDKWLAKVHEILQSNDINSLELLDIIHSDLVSSEIVVFTPKGDQKAIQNGSTALDFAYSIHTHIGNGAIAAKVNMKLAPLSQVLKPGDQVEIITARNSVPKMEWLQFLKTRHAKSIVIEYFKKDRNAIAARGSHILSETLAAMHMPQSPAIIKQIQEKSQINDRNELYFRIGLGLIGPEDFRSYLNGSLASIAAGESYIVSLSGDKNRKYVMADCCNPIPGDPIVGFLTGEDVVLVHKKSCVLAENMASKYGDRLVAPRWVVSNAEYPIRLSVKGIDRLGLLNEISNFISNTMGVNMRKLFLGSDQGIFEGYIELLVKDKHTLDDMVEGLKKIDGIQDVIRTEK